MPIRTLYVMNVGRGWSCITVGGDQGSVVRSSGLELKPSKRRGCQSGEELEEVKT